MSVASTQSKGRSPLKMQPNASFIMDEITDADAEHVTPHALHNKRFTKKYLKNVFPGGFGVQNVRTGRDLKGDKLMITNKKHGNYEKSISPNISLLSNANSVLFMSTDDPSIGSVGTTTPRSITTTGTVLTAPIIPNIMELNRSLASNVAGNKSLGLKVKLADTQNVQRPKQVKGTTGTKAPEMSFTDAFKGANYFSFDQHMNDSLVEDGTRGNNDKGAPDDFADVAGPYFTEIAQIPVAPTVHIPTSPDQGRPDTTSAMLKGVVDMSGIKHTVDDVSLTYSLASSVTSGHAPPQQNKELTARTQLIQVKPKGDEVMREYIHRARQADVRNRIPTMQMPALLPALPSSVRMITGTGGPISNQVIHGIPSKGQGMFTNAAEALIKTALQNELAKESWNMGAAVAGAAAMRAGYDAVIQIPTAVTTENSIFLAESPKLADKSLTSKLNSAGNLMTYDEWISGHEKSQHKAKADVIVNSNTSASSEMRVEVKRTKQVHVPEQNNSGGLGYQTFPSSIHVLMYSFQQVLGASSAAFMNPQYEFEMSRDTTLEQLIQIVTSKAAQLNASEIRFDNDKKPAAPVLFAYMGSGPGRHSWKALEKPLEWSNFKLQAISFLEKRRPLRLMYSMHPNDELDEVYLYENRTTLTELRDFEQLGYEAPQLSAGFGLRQIQADGSPAASRQRASTAPSPMRPFDSQMSMSLADQSDNTKSVYVPRPQSPTVSRSSNKAVAAVSGSTGSGVSPQRKARPASSDHSKTRYPLTRTTTTTTRQIETEVPKVLTTEEINEMTGNLLGETFVPPPTLTSFEFPPKKGTSTPQKQDVSPVEHMNKVNTDEDVASIHSLHTTKSNTSKKNPTTNTLTMVDIGLMAKYGSPPKPSFGQKVSNRAQSPQDLSRKKKQIRTFPSPKNSPTMHKSKSLATLLLTHTPNQGLDAKSAHSDVMSASYVRDVQVTKKILGNMGIDKQNKICAELEGRLMLTKW